MKKKTYNLDADMVEKVRRLFYAKTGTEAIRGTGKEIGLNAEEDRQQYHVDPAGLVVIPRGGRREFLGSREEL